MSRQAPPRRVPLTAAAAAVALLLVPMVHAGFELPAPAPKLRYQQEPFERAISKCTSAGLGLPVLDAMAVAPREAYFFDAGIRLDPVPGLPLPTAVQLVVNDAGNCAAVDIMPFQVLLQSCMTFDLDLALSAMRVRSTTAGQAVLWATICDTDPALPGTCAEFRRHVRFVAGSNAIETVACDAPPVLLPEDDSGTRNDDDYTAVVNPRFTVMSDAGSVELLRDGIVVDSAPVIEGMAVLTDALDPPLGLLRYQARHDAAQPSAGRYIVRYVQAVFADGFEATDKATPTPQ